MHKRITFAKVLSLSLVLGYGLFLACKKPSDGVEVTVNTDIYTTPMLFRFANADTAATSQPADFTVTVTGEDASAVVTPEGGKTFTTSGGVLALMLEKSAAPSPENPVQFSIIGTASGFTPVVQNVTITSDSAYTKEVRLVAYSKPAGGTGAGLLQTSLNAGVLSNATTITTATSASTTEAANIVFPAGTKFYAANGTQITSGSLDAKVVYYGIGSDMSLNAFPGGFNANNITGEDGKAIGEGATFVTGGFLAVNMTVGSTVVKSFSAPLQVTMQLSNGLVNPNTGSVVKAGDIIPVWSLDEGTGKWQFEANATVASSNGKLVMQYNITHLSCWNGSWPYYRNGANSCYKSASAPLKVLVKAGVKAFYGKIYLATANGQPLVYNAGGLSVLYNNGIYSFTGNLPNMSNAKVVIADQFGKKLAESALFNPCSTNTLELTVPSTVAFPSISMVSLRVSARCTNKSITANLTNAANVYIWNGTAFVYFQSVYVYNGQAVFPLINNQRYRVDTYYGKKSYSTVMDFKSKNFTFSGTVANADISGSAVYNNNDATYTVTGDIAVNCN